MTQAVVAQGVFKGMVCEDSTTKTPLFQAEIFILANGAEVLKLTSGFDGVFAIKTAKNIFYSVKVAYPGCKDVSVEFQTDKKGNPTPASAIFVMKKDGLRLVGKVRDAKTQMPIAQADVILKDIQTREETRFTTGKDGAYNLKLRYETNYRVSIDKRSPGIVNRYEDTVFFVSTLGFNQPLDYALDIVLRPAQQLTNRTEYSPPPNKPASKPVVEVQPTLKPDASVNKMKEINNPPKASEAKPTPNLLEPKEPKSVEKEKHKKESLTTKENRHQKSKIKKASVTKSHDNKSEIADSTANLKKKKPHKKHSTKGEEKINSLKQNNAENRDSVSQKELTKHNNPQHVVPTEKLATPSAVPSNKVDSVQHKDAGTVIEKPLATLPQSKTAATIYFVKNASFITEFSKSKLKLVIDEMKANSTRKVLLNVHAGKDEQNADMLCQTRLNSVKQFLVQNGISLERIVAKSNGNTVPANDCHKTNDCSEQKLIFNRRLEVIWE
jgi:outer membrane protein OmpA-like peptidoglycan-associated protein